MRVSTFLTQVLALARRSTVRTMRQPAVIISALFFPMMFFSINASGLDAASKIPGFPADSYLDFAFAFPLIQASLFGAVTAGADLARDIESGFFDRLSLTPMRPVALLGGMLAGVVALGLSAGRRLPHGRAAHGRGHQQRFRGHAGHRAAHGARRARVRGDRGHTGDKDGFRRGGRERFPAVLRGDLYVFHQPSAEPDRTGLVPLHRDHQPDLLPGRRHKKPGDNRLGPASTGPRLRLRPGHRRGRHRRGRGCR